MIAWLRRVFRRPPTIRDCVRAACGGSLEAPQKPIVPSSVDAPTDPPAAQAASTAPWRNVVDEVHVIREDVLRTAIAAAPCEPMRAPESGWVRGSGAPPRVDRGGPVVVLSDEEYEAWLLEHGDDAA